MNDQLRVFTRAADDPSDKVARQRVVQICRRMQLFHVVPMEDAFLLCSIPYRNQLADIVWGPKLTDRDERTLGWMIADLPLYATLITSLYSSSHENNIAHTRLTAQLALDLQTPLRTESRITYSPMSLDTIEHPSVIDECVMTILQDAILADGNVHDLHHMRNRSRSIPFLLTSLLQVDRVDVFANAYRDLVGGKDIALVGSLAKPRSKSTFPLTIGARNGSHSIGCAEVPRPDSGYRLARPYLDGE